MAFPTIYRHGTLIHYPDVNSWDDTMSVDPTIRGGPSDGGYTVTRARFTRTVRKWTINYTWVSRTNKETIRAYEEARHVGAEYFQWTNPENSTTYWVRFSAPITYRPHPNTNFLWWMVEFVLEAV